MGVQGKTENDSGSDREEAHDAGEQEKLNGPYATVADEEGSYPATPAPVSLRQSLRERGGRPTVAEEEGSHLADTPLLSGDRPQGATNFEAMLNLLNSLLGNSMLALPWAFGQVGMMLGVLLLILGTALNRYTLHLLLQHVDRSGSGSYPLIGRCACGRPGEMIVISVYLTVSSGAMCAYGVGLTDIVVQLAETWGYRNLPRYITGLVGVSLCAPGMFQPSLKQVAKFSVVNFFAASLFCCILLSFAFMPHFQEVGQNPINLVREEANILKAWPIFGYVFATQPSGVMVLSKLEAAQRVLQAGRTLDDEDIAVLQEERRQVSGMAYVVALTVGSLIGISSYALFGESTRGNILKSVYQSQDQLWTGALTLLQVCSAVMLLSSAAFVMVPFRFAVLEIMRLLGCEVPESAVGQGDAPTKLRRRITVGLLLLMSFVAAFCDDISAVYRVIGSVATQLFALILPGVFALKFALEEPEGGFRKQVIGPLLVTAFGAISLCLCVAHLFDEPPN